ncbi:MAG: tetratricopeptide repeat protein [Pseudomonadota bacterium]|nr:tetratricopeptide repeat protein [Pseudomonadota bacterium]
MNHHLLPSTDVFYLIINTRHGQASTYHQLGIEAEEQRQWAQAQQYYQKDLAICIEFNDRYGQASTYHHLGLLATKQQQWEQAQNYLLKALTLFFEFEDEYSFNIALENLADLYQKHPDDTLPTAIADLLDINVVEVKKLLQGEQPA